MTLGFDRKIEILTRALRFIDDNDDEIRDKTQDSIETRVLFVVQMVFLLFNEKSN